MPLFIREHSDSALTASVKQDLEQLVGATAKTRPHLYLPSRPLPGIAKFSTIPQAKYIPVKYNAPDGSIDFGQWLVDELANDPKKYVFIHPGQHGATLNIPNRRPLILDFNSHGGGFTTEILSNPHVDIFLDATNKKHSYEIKSKEPTASGGWRSSTRNAKPYMRLYHELIHAKSILFGLPHSEKTVIDTVNKLRDMRNLGYQRRP